MKILTTTLAGLAAAALAVGALGVTPSQADETTRPPNQTPVQVTVTNTQTVEHQVVVTATFTVSGQPTVIVVDGAGYKTVTAPPTTVTVGHPGPAVTVTVHPDPFQGKCHGPGATYPWWCGYETLYRGLVEGWIN